jgi:Flp pilus assembly protein TadG
MRVLDRQRKRRKRRGAVIVEFALMVPFLFIVVFGVIDFSRAYSQLNAINAGLREGARFASVMRKDILEGTSAQGLVRQKVQAIAAVFGYNSLDASKVTLTLVADPGTGSQFVIVTVTAHPVPLPVLGKFLGLSPFSITRSVRYRWERTNEDS